MRAAQTCRGIKLDPDFRPNQTERQKKKIMDVIKIKYQYFTSFVYTAKSFLYKNKLFRTTFKNILKTRRPRLKIQILILANKKMLL